MKPPGKRLFVWLLSGLTAGGLAIAIAMASVPDYVVFPSQDSFKIEAYTDASNNGNSKVELLEVTDSMTQMSFSFGEDFHSPYVGLSFTPLSSSVVDVSKYNRLTVEIQGIGLSRVGIALYSIPERNSSYEGPAESLNHSYLNISDQRIEYHLPIKQFHHPEWWEDVYGITSNTRRKPDLSRLLHVNIGTAFTARLEGCKKLRIDKLSFSRDNRLLYLWLGSLYVLLSGFLCFWRFRGTKVAHPTPVVEIAYRPVSVDEVGSKDEACINYINTHYHLSDLSLDKVATQTGSSPRFITQLIHDRFGCHFKAYLNGIRITESKRLLCKTEQNMGEIAFVVGFNNQSHFNRVFKSECGMSPSEYRKQERE